MQSLTQAITEAFAITEAKKEWKDGFVEIRCNPSDVTDIVDELAVEFPKAEVTIIKSKKSGKSVIEVKHPTDYTSMTKLDKLLADFDDAKTFKTVAEGKQELAASIIFKGSKKDILAFNKYVSFDEDGDHHTSVEHKGNASFVTVTIYDPKGKVGIDGAEIPAKNEAYISDLKKLAEKYDIESAGINFTTK